MKQIIYDYIHCTDLEFLIKHPFVTLIPVAIALVLILFIPWFINRRNKK